MKVQILIFAFLLLAVFNGFSQGKVPIASEGEVAFDSDSVSTTDPIEIKQGYFPSFYQNGEKLSTSLIREVVINNPQALDAMKQARKNYFAAIGFNTVGSFLVAYPVATTIFGGGKLDWKLIGVGAAFLGGGIPFTRAYFRHATQAAQIHNLSLGKSSFRPAEVQFGLNGAGLGLKMTF